MHQLIPNQWILAHRALWVDRLEDFDNKKLQNTREGFRLAFTEGYGVETDIRDYQGQLVMSHDIPKVGEHLSFAEFLQIYKAAGTNGVVALNIKADGLQTLVEDGLKAAGVDPKNFFVFDMSVPDGLVFVNKTKVPAYTRESEYEPWNAAAGNQSLSFYDKSTGVWLDQFDDPASKKSWINLQVMERHFKNGKDFCIVSPELHPWGRRTTDRLYESIWIDYRDAFAALTAKYPDRRALLCTDFPRAASKFFTNAARNAA